MSVYLCHVVDVIDKSIFPSLFSNFRVLFIVYFFEPYDQFFLMFPKAKNVKTHYAVPTAIYAVGSSPRGAHYRATPFGELNP